MLTYHLADRRDTDDKSSIKGNWYVGEPRPFAIEYLALFCVVIVRADCDELEAIRARMTGLRDKPKSIHVVWEGEDAVFILNNL